MVPTQHLERAESQTPAAGKGRKQTDESAGLQKGPGISGARNPEVREVSRVETRKIGRKSVLEADRPQVLFSILCCLFSTLAEDWRHRTGSTLLVPDTAQVGVMSHCGKDAWTHTVLILNSEPLLLHPFAVHL